MEDLGTDGRIILKVISYDSVDWIDLFEDRKK
jgi:hypothetical protein